MISKANLQILINLIEFDKNAFSFYANLSEIFKNEFFSKIAEFRLNLLQNELDFFANLKPDFEFSKSSNLQIPQNLQNALNEALNLEKSSVLFYENLLKNTKNKDIKEFLYKSQATSYNEILPILKICYENSQNLNLKYNEIYQNILNLIENKDKILNFENLENFAKTALDEVSKKFFKFILDKEKN
ncbi:MAG: hypothetical protein IKI43_01500 [Campylobacter sp.]|nr:hypothetical protein [Campylobacter sp.]